MTTLNFNAEFTTTDELVSEFAKHNGRQEFINVEKFKEIYTTINGETTTETVNDGYTTENNPITAEDFICTYMQNYLAQKLNELNVQDAYQKANIARAAQENAGLERIKSGLAVSVA